MGEIGIRELKQRASEILRQVREDQESFTVTYRGKVVARLVPVSDPAADLARASAIWTQMDELAREIGVHWPSEVSAAEAVNEQRREL
jgi:prevent-host-death family protein